MRFGEFPGHMWSYSRKLHLSGFTPISYLYTYITETKPSI